jgi:hypothetical protein
MRGEIRHRAGVARRTLRHKLRSHHGPTLRPDAPVDGDAYLALKRSSRGIGIRAELCVHRRVTFTAVKEVLRSEHIPTGRRATITDLLVCGPRIVGLICLRRLRLSEGEH